MLPAVTALAVLAVVAAPAVPIRLSWQMTATPIAGISSARHLRLPADGEPRPELDRLNPDQGLRMCDPYRSFVPPAPVPSPRPRGHAGVTVSRYDTLSDGI